MFSMERQCPVCGEILGDLTELEVHVNSHFDTKWPDSTPVELMEDSSVLREWESSMNGNNSFEGACASANHETCPICGLFLADFDDLTNHVNEHLNEDESSSSQIPDVEENVKENKRKRSRQNENVKQTNSNKKVFIPPSWKDNLKSSTSGVIEMLNSFHASKCNSRSQIFLCNNCTHFSTHKMYDSGFGCGYRNLQMILSCLSENPIFQERVFQGEVFIPSVYRMQMLLEEAWENGFDALGAHQLRSKVVKTRKWIGATEVATILSYLKVRCQIYDFTSKSTGPVSHPKLEACVRNYFQTDHIWRSPLYFQHQGHSRVIIGFEERCGSFNLIILDPGMPKFQMEQVLRTPSMDNFNETFLNSKISMPLSSFTCKQYQIVAVMGVMVDDVEVKDSKILTSIKMS